MSNRQTHTIRSVPVFVLVANILLFVSELFLFYVSGSLLRLVVIGMSIAAVSTRKWNWVQWTGIMVTLESISRLGSYGLFSSYGVDEYLFTGSFFVWLPRLVLLLTCGPAMIAVGLLRPSALSAPPTSKPVVPSGQTLVATSTTPPGSGDSLTPPQLSQPMFVVQIFGGEGRQFSIMDLQQMATTGLIKPTTLVQQVGSTFTVQASTIPGVFSDKNYVTALLLSLFLGVLGIDRFYLGYAGLGILKLLTAGGCGIWALIDLILIAVRKVKDADGRPLA